MELHWITRVLIGVEVILAAIIITCVALQQTKSEGLSGTIGGAASSQFRGSRQDEFLARITRLAGWAWMVVCLLLAYCWEHLRV